MIRYLDKAKSLIANDSKYPKLLSWEKRGPVTKIENCINSFSAGKALIAFCKDAGIDKDRLFALTQLLIALIPAISEPKVIAEHTVDFEGNYDFRFMLDDYVKILKKKPTSRPKSMKKEKQIPVYVETKVSYTFGLEYNPKTKLWRLRCKIYPQKSWWGFRFEEKYRSFDDLLSFVAQDLIRYCQDDQDDSGTYEDPDEPNDVIEIDQPINQEEQEESEEL